MNVLRLPLTVLGIFVVSAIGEQKVITAESGQNVTLTCRAPNNNIIVIDWSRADLEKTYVLQYRDEHLDPDDQHPSFKNRVDLQDREMKDGDVSLILKNVTAADAGTYECRVVLGLGEPMRSISTINLSVAAPPGPTGATTEDAGKEDAGKDGSVGVIVGLSVAALVAAAAVGFLIYRKHNRQSRDSSQPPDKEQSSEKCPAYLQVSSESPAADPDSVLSVNSGKEGCCCCHNDRLHSD